MSQIESTVEASNLDLKKDVSGNTVCPQNLPKFTIELLSNQNVNVAGFARILVIETFTVFFKDRVVAF